MRGIPEDQRHQDVPAGTGRRLSAAAFRSVVDGPALLQTTLLEVSWRGSGWTTRAYAYGRTPLVNGHTRS